MQSFSMVWREIHAKLQRRARHLCKGDVHRADELLSDTAFKVHLYLQHSPGRCRTWPASCSWRSTTPSWT